VPSGGDVDGLLTNVLISDGWSIQRAVDNQHALALATIEPFDLIVIGRKMLGPEDVELLRKIRSSRPPVRLIILTDKFTPGDVISAMREGAFSYFSSSVPGFRARRHSTDGYGGALLGRRYRSPFGDARLGSLGGPLRERISTSLPFRKTA
jgi:CheY-like chemotaxis protein